jgi:hypothetical protein
VSVEVVSANAYTLRSIIATQIDLGITQVRRPGEPSIATA